MLVRVLFAMVGALCLVDCGQKNFGSTSTTQASLSATTDAAVDPGPPIPATCSTSKITVFPVQIPNCDVSAPICVAVSQTGPTLVAGFAGDDQCVVTMRKAAALYMPLQDYVLLKMDVGMLLDAVKLVGPNSPDAYVAIVGTGLSEGRMVLPSFELSTNP